MTAESLVGVGSVLAAAADHAYARFAVDVSTVLGLVRLAQDPSLLHSVGEPAAPRRRRGAGRLATQRGLGLSVDPAEPAVQPGQERVVDASAAPAAQRRTSKIALIMSPGARHAADKEPRFMIGR